MHGLVSWLPACLFALNGRTTSYVSCVLCVCSVVVGTPDLPTAAVHVIDKSSQCCLISHLKNPTPVMFKPVTLRSPRHK